MSNNTQNGSEFTNNKSQKQQTRKRSYNEFELPVCSFIIIYLDSDLNLFNFFFGSLHVIFYKKYK